MTFENPMLDNKSLFDPWPFDPDLRDDRPCDPQSLGFDDEENALESDMDVQGTSADDVEEISSRARMLDDLVGGLSTREMDRWPL